MKKITRSLLIAVLILTLATSIVLLISCKRDVKYTVKFESNGGTNVSEIVDVEHGSKISEPSAPTKTGYSFEGWFSDARLATQWKFDRDTVTSDMTLYAKWTRIETRGLNMLRNGNTYTVAGIGNVSDATNIVIPERHDNLPVTTIAQGAFENVQSIQTVIVPSSVTKVLSGAFRNCENLVSVTFDGSSTTLGEQTFKGCKNLVSVTLPSGIVAIENELFYDCAKLSNVDIPKSVTKLGNHAFSGCKSITEVNLPASLTTLGENVFSSCISIEKLSVELGNSYFYSRDNGVELNCIIAVDTTGNDGNKLVVGCKTSRISGNSARPVKVIGQGAFYGCSTLNSFNIPYGVTKIEDEAFQGCTTLASIIIPASVVSIGDYAFSSCESLKSVTFVDPSEDSSDTGIQVLGQEAFSYCFALSPAFHLPASLTSIGAGLLCGCEFRYMTVSYGADVNMLQSLIQDGKDGNDDYTTSVLVRGDRGTSINVSGLA